MASINPMQYAGSEFLSFNQQTPVPNVLVAVPVPPTTEYDAGGEAGDGGAGGDGSDDGDGADG
eukprot:4369723-Prymnesium_polylepis.1